MIPIDLTGRTALITGASGGLGRALVRTLADAGADIIIHYHNDRASAEKLVTEVHQKQRNAFMVQGDITNEASVHAMKTEIKRGFTLPDIVVANAVIQYSWRSILEQPIPDFESQFRSSVLQSVFLAKAFIPQMIDKGFGRIIGINTECAMECDPNQGAYASGKRGMDGLYRVLAKEVGPQGITVNQVAPGWLRTEKIPDSAETVEYCATIPLRRRGTAEEVAATVAFLASDLAGFITGAYIPLCGGTVMPTI